MVNKRPQTLAKVVEIACLFEKVLDEQYEPVQTKEKNKNNHNSGGNKELIYKFQQALIGG